MRTVTLIPGDGIGPEIVASVKEIFSAAAVPLTWEEYPAGETAFKQFGELMPQDLIESIHRHKVALKGPIGTPVGKGFRSVNVQLRQAFELYVNERPVKNLPGVPSRYEDVDIVLFRENLEDLYAGLEYFDPTLQIADGIKRISRKGSERIIRAAFNYARKYNRSRVALFHKANIMKLTEGLFLEVGREIAQDYPDIAFEDLIIDNAFMQVIARPERFEVIVTTNMFGDILSDLLAGMVGGLGVVAGANLGHNIALFEAVHGTAPDIAGKGIANPTSLLLSALNMLRYLNFDDHAERIRAALFLTLENEATRTGDIGGAANTEQFTAGLIKNL